MPYVAGDLPPLEGQVVLITGANSGLGFETARVLAAAGAHVIISTRTAAKAEETVARIHRESPDASLETIVVDLSDLASVRAAASAVGDRHGHLDRLVNNAGVMMTPPTRTADGFELQVGVNHLGHFALTGLLLDRLLAADRARVVTVSSGMHRQGSLDPDDLFFERREYRPVAAYAQSKLANLLFMNELQRRFEAAGAPASSVAAHPGYAATNLQRTGVSMGASWQLRFWRLAMAVSNALVAQDVADGAMPQIHATAMPDVAGGSYWGPRGFGEMRGRPGLVGMSEQARDAELAARLWERSEALTGISYGLGART